MWLLRTVLGSILATAFVCLQAAILTLSFRGSRPRQISVIAAAVVSIGILWAVPYHALVIQPRQEKAMGEASQAVGVAMTRASNDETKFRVVEAVNSTQSGLRFACSIRIPLNPKPSDEEIKLRDDIEKIYANAKLTAEDLFSSELLAQMGTTTRERCAFADRLAGLNAMTGRVVGDIVWHFPLKNGESLELTANAKKEPIFTRLIAAGDAGN